MSDVEDRDLSDEEDEDSDEEDDLTRKLKQATSDMKSIFNGRATEDDIDDFINKHREVMVHSGPDATFLHTIVQLVCEKTNEKSVSALDVRPLVERLVRQYPDLLRTRNDEGQTPLYRAIYLKRYAWRLVDYMLNACSDTQCIDDALELPYGKGESLKTCLTLAFEKDLKPKVLQNLIRHASETALELKDGTKRTPFHYAVQYSQCSDERVGIIKLLLEKDCQAVDQLKAKATFQPINTFLDCKYIRNEEKTEYSVYAEHERTARAYMASELAKKERGDTKVPNANLAIREKEPPKASLREKDPKSRGTGERDPKKTDRNRELRKPDLERLDENERRRQLLREEERERLERKARGEKGQPRDQASGRDRSRTRPGRDHRERPDDANLSILKVMTNSIGSDHAPNTPLKRVPTQRFNVEEEKKKEQRPSTKSISKKPDPKILAKNSTKILSMLKLHYMRTRSIKMATSFLYGKNIQEDIQICFDYEGLPSVIQDTVFTERFGKDRKSGICFDEVLMYVRFPNVTVNRTGRRAPKPRAMGRQDMEFFFDWLYTKGVRRILKVEVDDSGKLPHSDESIQIALEKIVVEHLDWQKTDLDPRIIVQVGRKAEDFSSSETEATGQVKNKLREVTLRWSGNNAVLRAWSEPEGLPQLPELEVINLSIPAQADLYDTRNWVKANLEEFRVRLNKNANAKPIVDVTAPSESGDIETSSEPKTEGNTTLPRKRNIEVVVREGKKGIEIPVSSSDISKPAGRANPITEHEWLTCMERFAGSMDIFWKKTVDISLDSFSHDPSDGNQLLNVDMQNLTDLQNLKKDVVVALIDDGVDSCDSAFSGRVIGGKTFDYQDGGVGQYYISARGHGTEMARMILKVCPMASIYSIRFKTHSSPDKAHSTIDAISAASAIEAALEKNATIISMSWTIPEPPEGSEEKKLLDAVLERACSQKVLMFCSSSDQISATKHYPSAYKRKRFFLIGAAHDDGTAFGHAGKDNDFIFPGVNVNTTAGSSLPVYLADKTSSTKESTGSSIATALAAGLAALITYCFKASALAIVTTRVQQGKDYVAGPELLVKPADVDRIIDHDILKTAFTRIGKLENGQFIQVWDRFGPASRVLEAETNTYGDKLTCIMNLCSNLIER
ncbi:uncharacterized protein GIQ15_01939 [Arthroderma uncinatum]|uniref:uncharacterized protein n=1 Tax=Arthroderma uncinatum TaxID=74035 RepID=UPI00144AB88A|nr:uncharacterized protein GIQ15_01939 [Arthroderma uncinatum]KAF3492422.1 hypothetical protein GIQ15_01939 [Arthroderma uncinatum]